MRTKPITIKACCMRTVHLLLISLFALLFLTESCCKDKKITIEHQIKMSAGSISGTKALITDKEALIHNSYDQDTGFGVYGYKKTVKSSGTKHLMLFDDTEVKPDERNNLDTDWSYSPTRYWDSDPDVSYQFIAFWPHLPNVQPQDQNAPYVYVPKPATITDNDKVITIYNVKNWQNVYGNDDVIDYMTATRVGRYSDFNDGKVSFQFRHALSQLVIKAYYAGKEEKTHEDEHGVITGGVRISRITLSNYTPADAQETAIFNQLKTDGKIEQAATAFNVMSGTVNSTLTQKYDDRDASITPTMTTTPYVLDHFLDIPIIFKDELSEDQNYLNNFQPDVVGQWLMVPHVWYKLNLTIDFSVGDAAKQSSLLPVALVTENGYTTQPGKTYVLTLRFDTTGGGFTVEQVAVRNWNDFDVNKELYNW